MANLKSVRLKTKELLRFHSGCHGMKISLVSNRNVVSAVRDLVPTSKNLYLLQTDEGVSDASCLSAHVLVASIRNDRLT